MRRRRSSPPLRGSVTQSNSSVRMRASEDVRGNLLIKLGILGGTLLVFGSVIIWLWHVGWPQRQTEKLLDAGLIVTKKAEFAVKDIVVEGRQQVSKDALTNALGTIEGAPILAFDAEAAQKRVAKLPWVGTAVVERRLPDTIIVKLTERTAMARWQHDGRTVVIDNEGGELTEAKLDQFDNLPLVVGSDAPGQAHDLLETLKEYPSITTHMMAAVRVGERRWDLHLQPKTVAKLPEMHLDRALSMLSDMINDKKILERDIVTIDLRDPNKMVFEPGASGTSTNAEETK